MVRHAVIIEGIEVTSVWRWCLCFVFQLIKHWELFLPEAKSVVWVSGVTNICYCTTLSVQRQLILISRTDLLLYMSTHKYMYYQWVELSCIVWIRQ